MPIVLIYLSIPKHIRYLHQIIDKFNASWHYLMLNYRHLKNEMDRYYTDLGHTFRQLIPSAFR